MDRINRMEAVSVEPPFYVRPIETSRFETTT